jgi:hypothetical protein
MREVRGGEPYEYFPLGKYVVAAPAVCGAAYFQVHAS